ncbi:hypothetical protein SESBI_42334 [Sesbania bispinosa]|nr:hypothetical protein SESBI_42334 [Sesbania bispinosa]
MKVLVTGASGYLGGRLCDALLREGYSVRVLVRPTSDLSALPSSSEIFYGDITDYSSLLAALSGCSVWRNSYIRRRFFALGPTKGSIADENQVHHGKFFCTEYEKSKVAADKIAVQAASEGVPIVLLYPGVIYGPGKVTAGNVVARILYAMTKGEGENGTWGKRGPFDASFVGSKFPLARWIGCIYGW